MSNWIDADKLHEQMQWGIEHDMYDKPFDYIAEIYDAPTIDICFCRECKHWHDHITSSWCSRGAELRPQESGWIKRNADDFCSRGERKNDETD